jgi:aryl-alcohol dehydrogenase-like predicted oxidoreductase
MSAFYSEKTMKMKPLFKDGPIVSELCLGTANYGTFIDKKEAFAQMDYFYEHGGTILDTAHIYGNWVPNCSSASEKIIGLWLKERKLKNKITICTKGGHPDLNSMDRSRLAENEVRKDLEESLRYLKIDSIDLYFLHRDDQSIPVSDLIGMLEMFEKEGKIINYGCSNWRLSRIQEADKFAKENLLSGFICNQLLWSIGDINASGLTDKSMVAMDKATYDYYKITNKTAMAYMSLCKGYFSKKLHGTIVSPKDELLYNTESNRELLELLPKIKQALNTTSTPILLAYLINQPFTTIPIASFSSIEQLREAMSASDLSLSEDIIETIRNSRKYIVY